MNMKITPVLLIIWKKNIYVSVVGAEFPLHDERGRWFSWLRSSI
jgi:hypothetical protein